MNGTKSREAGIEFSLLHFLLLFTYYFLDVVDCNHAHVRWARWTRQTPPQVMNPTTTLSRRLLSSTLPSAPASSKNLVLHRRIAHVLTRALMTWFFVYFAVQGILLLFGTPWFRELVMSRGPFSPARPELSPWAHADEFAVAAIIFRRSCPRLTMPLSKMNRT